MQATTTTQAAHQLEADLLALRSTGESSSLAPVPGLRCDELALAGPGFDGTDAVHTHMTNSRLTDPEVLELRFPVLLERFAIRRGSGGAGRHHGGDGVVRRVRFLEPMTAAILANHRKVPPFGLAGGAAGQVGRTWVERADGTRIDLDSTDSIEMAAGDVFVIETPGGGGFGAA